MKDLGFELRLLWRIGLRKLRTLIKGPPSPPDFIRAAHYFSDGWALNMWQILDTRHIKRELLAVKEDGFNTIILVVPWRGFQTDQLSPAYDSFYEGKLRSVMAAAERLNLSIIVRVGYSHQVFVDSHLSGIRQAQRLLIDTETCEAWLDYLRRLYRICHGYHSFYQGFLSWEEFWHAFANWQLLDEPTRQEMAVSSGFLDYLAAQGINEVNEIPKPDGPLQAEYHGFTNASIRETYNKATQAFPGLGMEFRVDKERLPDGDAFYWAKNDDYADIDALRYSYWAPFMGAKNEGEKLSAAEASHLLEHMLDDVSFGGERPNHVVDQFNFVDETPLFKGVHAEIADEEVADFLRNSVPLFLEKSRGYGIWSYRDYRQNILFNARFLRGLHGWEVSGGRVKTLRKAGIQFGAGAVLRQYLPPPVSGLQHKVGFSSLFLAVALRKKLAGARLEARINAGSWHELELSNASCELSVEIELNAGLVKADGVILEMRNIGRTIDVNAVTLFHWVFRGGFRFEDGTPARHHEALVAFNRALALHSTLEESDQTH